MGKHPMQPLIVDPQGVVRFQSNAIVALLLEAGTIDMDKIASVAGYRDLSYADSKIKEKSRRKAKKLA